VYAHWVGIGIITFATGWRRWLDVFHWRMPYMMATASNKALDFTVPSQVTNVGHARRGFDPSPQDER
jgi:hypothetical protein